MNSLKSFLNVLRQKIKKERDFVSPTTQHLLAITLNPSLPVHSLERPLGSPIRHGYHLALFSSRIHTADLAFDGYDQDFSPPEPFTRRMWAGGEFVWNSNNPILIGQDLTQTTSVKDIKIGSAPNAHQSELPKSIFVTMEKRIENQFGWSLKETRTLVYIDQSQPLRKSARILPRVNKSPDFSSQFKPDLVTLFRYSALTFNSHLIHYDKSFAKEHEGYQDCLVHGPLTITLLLQLLEDNLPRHRRLASLSYRATHPLLVNSNITLSGKQAQTNSNMYEIWAHNEQGGLAMKGSAVVI